MTPAPLPPWALRGYLIASGPHRPWGGLTGRLRWRFLWWWLQRKGFELVGAGELPEGGFYCAARIPRDWRTAQIAEAVLRGLAPRLEGLGGWAVVTMASRDAGVDELLELGRQAYAAVQAAEE